MAQNRRWEAFCWAVGHAYEQAVAHILGGRPKAAVKERYARAVAEAWERLWEETP